MYSLLEAPFTKEIVMYDHHKRLLYTYNGRPTEEVADGAIADFVATWETVGESSVPSLIVWQRDPADYTPDAWIVIHVIETTGQYHKAFPLAALDRWLTTHNPIAISRLSLFTTRKGAQSYVTALNGDLS